MRFYLISLNAQGVLHDYSRMREYVEARHWRQIYSDATNLAGIVMARESSSQMEADLRKFGYDSHDSFKVIVVSDFDWPSALPKDDDILLKWLENHSEWKSWRSHMDRSGK